MIVLVWAVKWFLNSQNVLLTQIYCQIVAMYEEKVMNKGNIQKYLLGSIQKLVQCGKNQSLFMMINTQDVPFIISEELKGQTDEHMKQIQHLTLDEISEKFPVVLQSLLYKTATILRQ